MNVNAKSLLRSLRINSRKPSQTTVQSVPVEALMPCPSLTEFSIPP